MGIDCFCNKKEKTFCKITISSRQKGEKGIELLRMTTSKHETDGTQHFTLHKCWQHPAIDAQRTMSVSALKCDPLWRQTLFINKLSVNSHQLKCWMFKQCTSNSSQPGTNSNNNVYWKHHIVVQQFSKDILIKLTKNDWKKPKNVWKEWRRLWSKRLHLAQLLTLYHFQCDNVVKTKSLFQWDLKKKKKGSDNY